MKYFSLVLLLVFACGSDSEKVIFKSPHITISAPKHTLFSEDESLFVAATGAGIQVCLYDSLGRKMFTELMVRFQTERLKQLTGGNDEETLIDNLNPSAL